MKQYKISSHGSEKRQTYNGGDFNWHKAKDASQHTGTADWYPFNMGNSSAQPQQQMCYYQNFDEAVQQLEHEMRGLVGQPYVGGTVPDISQEGTTSKGCINETVSQPDMSEATSNMGYSGDAVQYNGNSHQQNIYANDGIGVDDHSPKNKSERYGA